jgi:hypothetical protein
MAFSENFSVSQVALNPALVFISDDSTGTDAAITSRRAYVQTSLGTYLVESGVTTDYNAWALGVSPLELDILSEDTAVSITIQWLNVSNAVLYTKTQSYCLAYYNKQFLYELVQAQALTPNILQDANYNSNVATFWTTIIGAINSVEFGADIAAAQASLNRGTEMRLNQSKYF